MSADRIQRIFDQLKLQMADVGLGDRPQPPCPREQLDELQARANSELGHELPQGYLRLLSLSDGISWDGAVLFASHPSRCVVPPDPESIASSAGAYIGGIVEENVAMRRSDPQLAPMLFFGTTESDWLVYDTRSRRYQQCSRVTWDVYGDFDDFESMIWSAFARALRLPVT